MNLKCNGQNWSSNLYGGTQLMGWVGGGDGKRHKLLIHIVTKFNLFHWNVWDQRGSKKQKAKQDWNIN